MKIFVCVKIVDGDLNPFDACALEAALCVENAEVSVVSMCPPSAAEKLRALTRLGVKNVYLLSDKAFAGSDTLATSYILSEFLKKHQFDLVFCGRQTIDGDTAQVGPCLATILNLGLITNVLSIDEIGAEISCKTRLGDEKTKIPALLTIERINNLRFPSIRSRLGDVTVLSNAEIGADTTRCGLDGSPTRVLKTFENQRGKRKCSYIQAEEFKETVSRLLEQKKEEVVREIADTKLEKVWAIGDVVAKRAEEIAENVVLIGETDPVEIARMAKKEMPDVILWNADLWGRKTAPQVSAMLGTGLCADCTHLETDGKRLFMYRPARSGNIIAKIECRTNPQMATVRCEQKSDDLIISGGRGIADFDALRSFTNEMGAQLCASRALVDKNVAPYEMQVGLTGKTVSPKVYIAIGISGEVQHTCAIENADFIIAINPDKDAKIFEYADFGIVSTFEDFLEKV